MTRKSYSLLPQLLKYTIIATTFSILLLFSGVDKLYSLLASVFPQEKSVRFTSSPQGINLYTLESGRLKHLGTTPTSISITFRSEKSSKRIHCKKIGYKTQKILAKPTESVINVNLEKKDIFRNPAEFSDSKHAELQKKITLALEELIYSPKSILEDETFEILGEVGLVVIAEFNYLRFDILLDDDFRREKLRIINRIADKNQRYNKLAEEGLNKGGAKLLFELVKALNHLESLDGIFLVAKYSKTKLVLVDETFSYRETVIRGGPEYSIITSWNQPYATKKMETAIDLCTILYEISNTKFSAVASIEKDVNQLKQYCSIQTNDNHKKEFEFIEVEKK
jgi:hypothetical protein